MTFQQYKDKWFVNTGEEKIDKILEVFDILYLEFSPLQAVEMLSEYLNNADDIYNDKNANKLAQREEKDYNKDIENK